MANVFNIGKVSDISGLFSAGQQGQLPPGYGKTFALPTQPANDLPTLKLQLSAGKINRQQFITKMASFNPAPLGKYNIKNVAGAFGSAAVALPKNLAVGTAKSAAQGIVGTSNFAYNKGVAPVLNLPRNNTFQKATASTPLGRKIGNFAGTPNTRQTIAGLASTALLAAGGEAATAKAAVAKNTLIGGAFGAAGAESGAKAPSRKELAKSIATGAVLGGGGTALGKALARTQAQRAAGINVPKSALDNHIVEEPKASSLKINNPDGAKIGKTTAIADTTKGIVDQQTGKATVALHLPSANGAPGHYAELTPAQALHFADEKGNLKPDFTSGGQLGRDNIHVSDLPKLQASGATKISIKELADKSPPLKEALQKFDNAPKTDVAQSGSALRTKAQAVEQGMKADEQAGATYSTVSHKVEAEKAVKLLQEDPEKAKAIAMGARGDNASHEAAVYHAVKNQALETAKKTGDYSEVMDLANSTRHTAVSEAAQKLGAEGYNTDVADPVARIKEVQDVRRKVAGVKVASVTKDIQKEVKSRSTVSRQDWHSFVQDLRCK
jgi:hypothetical protein